MIVLVPGCGVGTPPALDEWRDPATGMAFVRVPSGRFVMGSPPGEAGREAQERQHEVEIARPFYLGKYEVTQREWQAVAGTDPSWFSDGPDMPVESVTFFEIERFLEQMTASSAGNRFRLPTEAEWEYACRAGTTTAYPEGDVLTAGDANFDGRPVSERKPGDPRFRGRPSPVGSFAPNPWGLHDMNGNLWEWTADPHCEYASGSLVDPIGRCESPLKVIRGGSWYFGADSARCALRYTHDPGDRGFSLGFRVVREEP
jgi:formylglycine-generating enzyme required for sulfatase activity